MPDQRKIGSAPPPRQPSLRLYQGPSAGRRTSPYSPDPTISRRHFTLEAFELDRFRERAKRKEIRLKEREMQVKAICRAAFFIVQTRGRVMKYHDRFLTVGGHGFTIGLNTPFNRSLVQPALYERKASRRFGYRIIIWRNGGRCLDAFWNTDRDFHVESIDPKCGWRKKFLKGARHANTWHGRLDYR